MTETNATLIQSTTFKPVQPTEAEIVASWLALPDVAPYWNDNGFTVQDLKKSFVGPSMFEHWFAWDRREPYAYLMSSDLTADDNEYREYIDHNEKVRSLDILIALERYKGLGLAHRLIQKFLAAHCLDSKEVFIDPDASNTRAIRVYEKAGFNAFAEFVPTEGAFKGKPHLLMRHDLSPDKLNLDFTDITRANACTK